MTNHKTYLESIARQTNEVLRCSSLTDTQKFRLRSRADHEAVEYIRVNTKSYCEYQELFKYYRDISRI